MTSPKYTERSKKGEPKTPLYQDVDGFRIPPFISPEAYKSALAYKPRPDDLFIVTYPKCGTTWVLTIVAGIFNEGKGLASGSEYYPNAPFLELTGAEAAATMKRPGAIKMHLPFWLTPWNPEAKYIFIARNPKDCCVSHYYHTTNIPGYYFEDGDFDDFFELFVEGKVDFGDYYDTLLSWYEHKNDTNVLFLTYEQLKKDTRTYVLKIAEFIDTKYRDALEEDEKMLEDVLHSSSFQFVKKRLNTQVAEFQKKMNTIPKDIAANSPDLPPGLKYMVANDVVCFSDDPEKVELARKGIVGDWRNHFSPEQNARFEKKFRERTAGTDIPDLWKDDM